MPTKLFFDNNVLREVDADDPQFGGPEREYDTNLPHAVQTPGGSGTVENPTGLDGKIAPTAMPPGTDPTVRPQSVHEFLSADAAVAQAAPPAGSEPADIGGRSPTGIPLTGEEGHVPGEQNAPGGDGASTGISPPPNAKDPEPRAATEDKPATPKAK